MTCSYLHTIQLNVIEQHGVNERNLSIQRYALANDPGLLDTLYDTCSIDDLVLLERGEDLLRQGNGKSISVGFRCRALLAP